MGEANSERERSQRRRKIVEEFLGWLKTVDGLRRSRGITGHTGWWKIAQQVALAAAACNAACNLVRMRRWLAA